MASHPPLGQGVFLSGPAAMKRSSRTTSSCSVQAADSALAQWIGPLSIYLAVALLVTLPGLGSTGIVMMEGMMVDTAETMLATGDFLVPRLYGEIYSYKPPLVYWTTALALHLGGRTEWALRLPSALAGIAMGFALLILVGRVTQPRTGLFAALAAITGILFLQKLKVAEFDAPLAAAVGIAVAAACHNLAAERSKRCGAIWFVCYLAVAAAFLAKGVPALMAFAPGLLAAAVVTRRSKQLLSRTHVAAALLCALIIASYLWLAIDAAGPVILEQPLEEAHTRGFEWSLETLRWTLLKPLTVWVLFLPWSLVWLWSLRRPKHSGSVSEPRPESRLMRSGWAFLAGGLVAFMAVPTHQTRYYLPLAAAGAIVSALALERLRQTPGPARRWASAVARGFAAVAILAAALPHFVSGRPAFLLAVGVAALCAVQYMPLLRGRQGIGYLLLVAALCGWAVETWALRPRHAEMRDLSRVARTLGAQLPEEAPIWRLGVAGDIGKNASLYYYLERPVRTFRADDLPESGSYLILTAREPTRLEEASPGTATRLRLIRRVDHPRGLFLLYRIEGSGKEAA